jgi:predicted exporter
MPTLTAPATPPRRRRLIAIACWLLGVALCAIVIARTTFTTDLSAFLPQSPTQEQQVLLDQLSDGVVSRLILIGIEGADAPTRAALSLETARLLRRDAHFVTVNNGEPIHAERDRAFLFGNRYLLSPAVMPQRFTKDGLQAAIGDTIDLLGSPVGMLVKPLLPRDPTAEIVQLLEQMNGASRPHLQHGVWAARDGARALLLAQTRAAGADIDAHQLAMQKIEHAFKAAQQQRGPGASAATLVMTGPAVFSVLSRERIKSEVTRLSIISTVIIMTLLLLVYRSMTALLLGLLPVVSGALVGVAAVSLGFGAVHGITLGFGTTLIGEAVDYSIYLFVQSRQSGNGNGEQDWIDRFWPMIRLGVLTSIVGFTSLLLSSFPGLAQLGMFTIAGLVSAAIVTRYVLPHLLPRAFRIRDVSAIGSRLALLARQATRLRWPLSLLIVAALGLLVVDRATLWNPELGGLSPVAAADQAIDGRLRADIGAPDTRYMIVVSGADQEAALRSSEKIAQQLQPLVARGVLGGFESPARYLPSVATQQARQASLPGAADLAQRLAQATAGLPVRTELFAPFLADIAAARTGPLMQRSDLDNTSLALALDALLFRRAARWIAVLPLTAVPGVAQAGSIPVETVRAALAAAGQPGALFVDLKAESNNLYSSYLREAILLSLAGLAGIVVLLLFALRSPLRVARVMLPLIGAVAMVAASLDLYGQRMTILHLVGLLLIVAVGSNYALFFNPKGGDDLTESGHGPIAPRTLASLVFANLTTVSGFGVLAFSQVPVLQAIGITVGPGAVLALIFSAIFADRKSAAAELAAPP